MGFNVAIVGAGLIGRKRAVALSNFGSCKLKVVVDINRERAEILGNEFGVEIETDWRGVVTRRDIDIVIVSTPNKFLTPICNAALQNGKHVLSEKPLGRNTTESKEILDSLSAANYSRFTVLKTGFNHRFHPAIAVAKEHFDNGEIGKLYFIRCRYGHGGRPGYEREWRADKDSCGGGELLDQGVHVVDLFRWFAGDFDEAFGCIQTYFWNIEVEDNAFAIFKKDNGIIATMHTSWTQWKNIFSFEVVGSKGYLVVEGLGGSYGVETLKFGRRNLNGGPPEEKVIEFKGGDTSWEKEWEEFISAIEEKRMPLGSGWDGYVANKMIEAVYESAKKGVVVRLNYEEGNIS